MQGAAILALAVPLSRLTTPVLGPRLFGQRACPDQGGTAPGAFSVPDHHARVKMGFVRVSASVGVVPAIGVGRLLAHESS